MKHLYLLVTLLCMVVGPTSCTDHDDVDAGLSGEERPQIHVRAIIGDASSTRTLMGSLTSGVYPVLWKDGDQIAIGRTNAFTAFTLSEGAGTAVGGFGGTSLSTLPGSRFYAACYPTASASASISGGTIKVGASISNKQVYALDNVSNELFPMASVTDDPLDFRFKNLGSVLQLRIKGDNARTNRISRIYFYGNDDETVAGPVALLCDATTGEPLTSSVEADAGCQLMRGEGSGIIVLDLGENGLTLSATQATVVNIVVMPQTFINGFTVRLVDADNGGSLEKTISTSITLKRSHLKMMKEFVYSQPEPLEVANCYVISEAGYQTIPAFCMGNRQSVLLDTKGKNLDAAILWSDCGMDAVSNIEYLSSSDGKGYISFKVKKDAEGNPVRGNCVVCLYDKDTNTILWTWHLWLTEEPQAVYTGGACADGTYTTDGYTFTADATKGVLAVMDRNLGAISANPNDGQKTYGLYYQMGRKDPFIGGTGVGDYNDRTNLTAKGYILGAENLTTVKEWETEAFGSFTTPTDWYSPLTDGWVFQGQFINLTYSIQHPMTFSSAEVSKDTRWTDPTMADNLSYMNTADNNTGLVSSGHEAYWNRTKTIFDPCPAGWTVLGERNGVFFGGKETKTAVTTAPAYGLSVEFTYNGTKYTSWWPAAGVRTTKGTMAEVGYRGAYLHYDHINATHGGHGTSFYLKTNSYIMDYKDAVMTNHATSIRCVRAKQP